MAVNRRRALWGLGIIAASPALGASAVAPSPGGLRFEHGVASGDPLTDRVILWTRITGALEALTVTWQVARDDAFTDLAASGTFTTGPNRDYTVKVDAQGLEPGRDYVYRFIAGNVTSPTGRTRTLPRTTDKVVLAVASCSLHPNGYFNAYRAIADLDRVDAVVHLGDYIYEYGAGLTDYGMGNGRLLNRTPQPPHEIVSLSDYRTRHAQYKSDTDLQAAHARAPWICVYDDHEVMNDCWTAGAENHDPDQGEGDFTLRKAAALKAYGEWMPIREAAPGRLAESIYRSFRFGQMAELIMTETRLVGRTQQLDYEAELGATGGEVPDFDAMRAKINDPSRELLGADQRAWLGNTLTASVRDGVRWQLLGNQVVMTRTNGPDVVKALGADNLAAIRAVLPDRPRYILDAMVGLFSRPDPFPFNLDAWDGYPAERERLYGLIREAGARMVVVSGDSHAAWANQLHDASGVQVAVEMGVTSITSPTRWLDSWLPDLHLAQTLADDNAEIIASDDGHNGFVRLTLTDDSMTGEWMAVDTILSRDFKLSVRKAFTARAGDTGVGPLSEI
ncbi:alkaline phosphatase D [Asticcacaulis biprosthecium C19]|uniref:Alkaline phosphatase D n=1 Tax=Asticcacaulis biprosthecium C19 TaxID=715226 RepID=F4QHV2_9CAUL|nr:alkaline phosphatase D family protein [Asticcacaulis biprosthecium]EGF92839.1 alkaline phosphatase D [Asticcacaulis biprosthecium C19]